ncbi:hypothetical protein ACHAWT_008627 [Skeletonema menzelii]
MHEPLSELKVADSTFLAFVCCSDNVDKYLAEVKRQHPKAAHIPYASSSLASGGDRCDDDGEPEAALVGDSLLNELKAYKNQLRRQRTMRISGDHHLFEEKDEMMSCGGTPVANAVIIVRYFGNQLLGVTCGRLKGVYVRVARLALHRHLHGLTKPFVEAYRFDKSDNWKNVYGLGAGDTELILDVINDDDKDNSESIVQRLMKELKWEGMLGSKSEMLPRLQNLQADLPIVGENPADHLIPVYRYPGNYSGTEWPTHPWSPTTHAIKECVEKALQPLYDQKMNHCVSNLYRDGADRIDHHSDKDLDLNRNGVIVSVSLGSTRVMELRDRKSPGDVARIELPEGSMFVLGPYTNARFTHAVLPEYEVDFLEQNNIQMKEPKCRTEDGGRISLTLRDVRTFLDVKTQRLFGQGISSSCDSPQLTEEGLRQATVAMRQEDAVDRNRAVVVAAAIGVGAGFVSFDKARGKSSIELIEMIRSVAIPTISATASYFYLRHLRNSIRQHRDEMEARDFFSKKSASGNNYEIQSL